MRRLIRAVGFILVALVAFVAMSIWRVSTTQSDELRTEVLGATEVRPPAPSTTDAPPSGTVPNRPVPGTASRSTSTTVRVHAVPTTTVPATSPSSTTTLVPDPSGEVGGPVVDQARALVDFDWQTQLPGWTVEFLGPRDGYRGATFPSSHLVQVYVRPDESAPDLAHALAHELGHAVDLTELTDADRQQFNVARQRPAASAWWVVAGSADFSSGSGDWAECFAWTVTDGKVGFSSLLGPPPNPLTVALVHVLDHD